MQNETSTTKRVPWNKGKLTGAKPPLRPKARLGNLRFELTEPTRQAIDDYLKAAGKKRGELVRRNEWVSPAALPLFAGGLGVIGLFGARRKRKAAAI